MQDPLPRIIIGMVGHVDHGKSTLTEALTGKFPDTYSDELKRGITIRLGYAYYQAMRCKECGRYTTNALSQGSCPYCGGSLEPLRKVSILDAPGHEALLTVMLSGASLIDGAVMVIAANEPCPRPQTREHMIALNVIGVKNIVVAQNKIELVDDKEAEKQRECIKAFLEEYDVKDAPIIPISAIHRANIDVLVEAIEKFIPEPERDLESPPLMYVVRSFDVNKPGTDVFSLKGGVLGGALTRGVIEIGDEIEILPGLLKRTSSGIETIPLRSEVSSLAREGGKLERARPGALIAIGTQLDPRVTKGDRLIGNVVGLAGEMPPVTTLIEAEVETFEYVVGTDQTIKVEPLMRGEQIQVTIGPAPRPGVIREIRDNIATIQLFRPVVAEPGRRMTISRKLSGRWRLIGYGKIKNVVSKNRFFVS